MSVPKKEVDFLAHPPPRALALAVALRLAGEKEGLGFSRGEMTSPQRSRRPPPLLSLLVSLALFVHIPSLSCVVCGSIRCVEFLRFIDLGFAMGQVE